MTPPPESGLVLRAARPEDVRAIATVWHGGWLDGLTREES